MVASMQEVTKRFRLSLLTNRAVVYESQFGGMGGGGRCAAFQPMRTATHITWYRYGAQIKFGDLPPYLTFASMQLQVVQFWSCRYLNTSFRSSVSPASTDIESWKIRQHELLDKPFKMYSSWDTIPLIAIFIDFPLFIHALGSGMFMPEITFSIPDSGPSSKKLPNPWSGSATKNLSFLLQVLGKGLLHFSALFIFSEREDTLGRCFDASFFSQGKKCFGNGCTMRKVVRTSIASPKEMNSADYGAGLSPFLRWLAKAARQVSGFCVRPRSGPRGKKNIVSRIRICNTCLHFIDYGDVAWHV